MQILLEDENRELTLSDDRMDNDSYIDLVLVDGHHEVSGTVNIDEIICALQAFQAKRDAKLRLDKALS